MSDDDYLQKAVELAAKSDEPIKCGVVLVGSDGHSIAETYNSQRRDMRTAHHAEMKAIALANQKLGRKLPGVTAFCSCEPCTMCLTAFIFAGVERIVFAHRLNDLVRQEQTIDIDCFEFVKKFPRFPRLEHRPVTIAPS